MRPVRGSPDAPATTLDNLISDVLPDIGLAMEPPDRDAMRDEPWPAGEPMLARKDFARLGTESRDHHRRRLGAAIESLCHSMSCAEGRTMAFGSLLTEQRLHALTDQAFGSAASAPRFDDPTVTGVVEMTCGRGGPMWRASSLPNS